MRHRAKPSSGFKRGPKLLVLAPVLAALLALVFVPDASALTQRPLKETFGSAEQPALLWPSAITVDQATGDVIVADFRDKSLKRFQADGTPAPFEALDTNVIDGKEANGEPCLAEPASCDKTPQKELEINTGGNEIAIDESGPLSPTNGDIYLSEPGSNRVNIFASTGRYLGQLTEAGPIALHNAAGVAVDSNGAVYVSDFARTGIVDKFVPTANPVVHTDLTAILEPELDEGFLGILAVGRGPTEGSLFVGRSHEGGRFSVLQIGKTTGEIEFEFGNETVSTIIVDPHTDNVLIGDGSEYEVPGNSQPQKVGRLIPVSGRIFQAAFNGASEVLATEGVEPGVVSVYGAPAVVPAVTVEAAGEVTGTKATLTGTVNPSGLPLSGEECIFEYRQNLGASTVLPCEGAIPPDSAPHAVHVSVEGLEPNGHTYEFRLVAFNENGREETEWRSFTTLHTVVTEPANAIGLTKATLNGVLRPEGSAYTQCTFEYGLATTPIYEKSVPCSPEAPEVPVGFTPHEVSAAISGLRGGATYRYRIIATNGALGTVEGEELTFTTLGLPVIGEVQASGADQSSVALEARINPRGFATSYFFEWGPTSAYGNLTPLTPIGAGTEPSLVQAKISGLNAASIYHYRVRATNSRGAIQSADHVAETLNSCDLPEGRCFELASRPEAGPVALPGEANAAIEMHFQAATGGVGGFAYPVEGGYPEATKGADVQYRAVRGASGWTSAQLSPPIVAPNERNDGVSVSSATQFLSNDLSCGVTDSAQPLTEDASMKLVREQGGSNLYRINPEGSSTPYTGITTLPPENAAGTGGPPNYNVAGASQSCGMVLFSTRFSYPGISTKARDGLRMYEWRGGVLRNAGIVPGPEGEVVVGATPGGQPDTTRANMANAVSEDGSRVFFTAERKTSTNPAEIGVSKAIFVREDGRETRDVSLSETAVPDEGAEYQWATPDGSRVFFTANAGLTAESNTAGTDLYEYDLETEELIDRSVTSAEGGAQVIGFLGASADGSRVYFASPNQLVPGSGSTRAQNLSAKSFSIYTEKGGQISFVGTFNQAERLQVVTESSSSWTSQVSPDGRYLMFESSSHVTGYESHGVREVYLYDAEGASPGTTCVSCRQDGQPSAGNRYGSPEYQLLNRFTFIANDLHPPRFLTEQDGEARVFFSSPDPLAPGAVPGQNNVYEWTHDQVFRLVSASPGSQVRPTAGVYALFGGASEDGSDVYLVTPETLTWQDEDERLSAYDARIGGGFVEPPAPPAACLPGAENSCQAPPQVGPVTPGSATTGDSGAQNFKPKKKSPTKKKHKKKHKSSKHKKKHKSSKHKKKKSKRQANGNRRNDK